MSRNDPTRTVQAKLATIQRKQERALKYAGAR